jgi:hypothetical protein
MGRHLKIVRSSREIALVSNRKGRTFLAMLAVEAAIFGVYFSWLSTVAGTPWDIVLPLAACLAVMAWTASYITADARLSLDLTDRSARMIHTSGITGRSTSTAFPLDQVMGVALRQVGQRRASGLEPREYAVGVALRDGGVHEFRIHGALIACRSTLDKFCCSAGLGCVARV